METDELSLNAKVVLFAKDEAACAQLLGVLGDVRPSDADVVVIHPAGLRAAEWFKRVHSLSLSARLLVIETTPGLASLLRAEPLASALDRATLTETLRSVLETVARRELARVEHEKSAPPAADDVLTLDGWSPRARMILSRAQTLADREGHERVTMWHCGLALAQSTYAALAFEQELPNLVRAEIAFEEKLAALPRTAETSGLGEAVLGVIAGQELLLAFGRGAPSIASFATALSSVVGFAPSAGWPPESPDAPLEVPFFRD